MLGQSKSRVFRFGQFELDPAQQRLSRNGVPLRMPASRIRLLHLFVTRSGELIRREEISSYLWHNSQTVDTVSGINTAVNQLRGHLGDDSASPRYIETVIGTGYRFIANVEQIEEPVGSSALPVEQQNDVREDPPAPAVHSLPAEPVVEPVGPLVERIQRDRKIVPLVAVVLVVATLIFSAVRWGLHWGRVAHFANPSGLSLKLDRVTETGDIASADISPDGKYIAYVRAAGSEDSLWLKQLATGRALELAAMGKDQCPGLMFSPDGSFVYFVRKAPLSASGDLYRIPFLGGNPVLLLTGVSGAPAISPDGRQVAFVRSTLTTHGEDTIVIASLDGSGERLLKSYRAPGVHFNRITWTRLTSGKQDVSPSVTPDGRWVVYASVEGERSVLKKVSSFGGIPIQLTDYDADSPAVSPNGDWIACSYTPSAKQPAMLAIVPISGGPPAKVFSLPETATPRLAWKPDGTAVSFINSVNGADNIWQQPLSGAPAVAVTHFTSGKIFGFRWSHDGRIALSRGTETVDAVLIKNFRDSAN